MYILDENNNTLQQATICTFKELNIEERRHLQEWIATEPKSLGEDLLIIQKEFDGFADTKERLDLLALDKEGRIVIIENKLDDSGRDVTWQAIKYASYCSSLSKQEIIDIFAKHLGDRQKAIDKLTDFFDTEDLEELELNVGENTQRIFFVAANFRKEVTSSVIWLSKFGLDIKCFKVTPFKYGDRILIDFDQIIPIKDTEDYTIKMAAKTKEAAQSNGRFNTRRKFWSSFIQYNADNNGPYATSSAGTDTWLGKSLGVSGITVDVVITRTLCRVELYFNFGDKDKNKKKYDFYFDKKDEIQLQMPEFPLEWQRLDDKVTCRIKTEKCLSYINQDETSDVMDFLLRGSLKFLEVFSQYNKQIIKV